MPFRYCLIEVVGIVLIGMVLKDPDAGTLALDCTMLFGAFVAMEHVY